MTAETIQNKLRIRTYSPEIIADIQDNIEACILDMKRIGINTNMPDKLMDKAIELYCKAEYNFMDKGEEFRKKYDDLRNAMSLCAEYMEND